MLHHLIGQSDIDPNCRLNNFPSVVYDCLESELNAIVEWNTGMTSDPKVALKMSCLAFLPREYALQARWV